MSRFHDLLWLITLALLWGPAFLFMKVAVQEIPPFTVVAVRVLVAAAILHLILKIQGHALPRAKKPWRHFTVMGLTFNALPYLLLSWAALHIDSGLSAVLLGTMPLFTVLFSFLLGIDERLSAGKNAGILLGFFGLLVLFAPALLTGTRATVGGLLAVVIAAATMSVALLYGRKHLRGLPPLVGPTAQLSIAAVILLPVSLLVDQPYTLPLPSLSALGSLLLLAVFPTALVFLVYYRAMERISAAKLSLVTYLIPIVATILGVVVRHERLSWTAAIGCALILLGTMATNGLISRGRLPGVGRLWPRQPARAMSEQQVVTLSLPQSRQRRRM